VNAVAHLVCKPFAAMASPKWMEAMALSVVAQYKSSVGKSNTGDEVNAVAHLVRKPFAAMASMES
jgi:hypothetical protein